MLSHPEIDIDAKDLSGVSPLWAACQNNNADVVELLLHPRSVVIKEEFVKDKQTGTHSKQISLTNKDLQLNEGIFDSIDNSESEHSDDENNDTGFKLKSRNKNKNKNESNNNQNRQYRQKGANANLAKHDGCTPLWIASSRGNHESMQILVNYGADLNKPDDAQGATPLFVAAQNGMLKATELLIANGADVNKARTDGTTPLMMAAHNGHVQIVNILLQSNGNPMKSNVTGLNALSCAAMQGHSQIVDAIYQHLLRMNDPEDIQVFINHADGNNGWTALHLGTMSGHYNVVKYLVQTARVDIYKVDKEGKHIYFLFYFFFFYSISSQIKYLKK